MKALTASWRALLLCLPGLAVQAQGLEIIDLRHRTAPEVIPVLQPLLEPGGALSGTDYKLFVRASPANLAQLKQALQQIDREARQFLVSVRRGSRAQIERAEVATSGTAGTGGVNATVRATAGSSSRDDSSMASVQVMEGGSAFIATGQSVPYVTAVVAGGRGQWVGASTSYRDVSSGFLVTPRVAGQRVTLDISQQAQRLGGDQSTVQTQQITTQISGALGEWISLGGISESDSSRSRGILSGGYGTRSDSVDVWVRVEER